MNQKFIDGLLKPVIVAIIAGIVVFVLGAWLTKVPMRSVVTLAGIKDLWFAPISAWVVFVVLVACGIVAVFYRRSVLAFREERTRGASLTAEIGAMKRKETKLHGVWNQAQAFWHMGRQGNAPMMQIGGLIDLTTSNTKDNLFLLAAYIDGHRSTISIEVVVKPNVVNRELVTLYLVPPLESDATKQFEATIVVEDQFNRKHELPRQAFRATPRQTSFPTTTKPTPELIVAWRVSGWCWTLHEGERVVRISGDAPIQLDNAPEKVLFTGVRVVGAEFVGIFDNFELEQGQRTSRGMNLDFRGLHPEGKEPVAVKLIFLDIRGNEYPTKEVAFKAIAEPKQFGGLPWPPSE